MRLVIGSEYKVLRIPINKYPVNIIIGKKGGYLSTFELIEFQGIQNGVDHKGIIL